ncbi:BON domain-containing protein [Candidatus Symbiobacter mobilis]|uniref:Extracytoplasmic protein n=1 Tax=Candidatus Symbiobacter mobilis CR TaxID=946483 RepID=U5N7K7_9BURK|nr:BON domain-containing protein [Candidatus Symbiobacter mobilis]AGX87342.1 extracytoplasmic protein [Candidatus Symbiobacter mobilis CR]
MPNHPIPRAALRAVGLAVAGALSLAALGTFGGCAPMFVGSAVFGGALVATDRRTSGIQLEDEGIETRAGKRIQDQFADRVRINVTSYNRLVLLTGEVPSVQDRQLAGQLVARVENVKSVVNELAVLGNTTLAQRSTDALITGKVKAAFVDARDLYANAVKVVTDRGAVYLMGRVSQKEADRATDIARSIPGVQKVVRVFELLSEEALQELLPKPIPAPARPPL